MRILFFWHDDDGSLEEARRGERETNEDIHRYHIDKDSNTPFDGGMDDFEATQIARGDQAQQALLCAGDVLLFNTTIFHFGEANRSNDPRVLLGFAFQSNNDDGDACFELDKTNGFTYHITPDVERAALKLLNFHLVKTPYSSGVHVRWATTEIIKTFPRSTWKLL